MKSPFWIVTVLSLMLTLHLLAGPRGVVIATYNLENYLDTESVTEGGKSHGKPKTEKAIEAVIRIVKEINPDILGVCEMGSLERFEDFKKRLADAGLGYMDFEYVPGADPDRHLALVSRYPIIARQSASDVPYELNGRPEKVRRGFLDVTIQVAPDYVLRMVGVHLKSKLAAAEGEAIIRRHEAQELRRHVEKIMNGDPLVNLVCYGDFNDTRDQPMYGAVTGVRGTVTYLNDLPAKDDLGDRWTHYWKTADLYSRIDYIFVSPALTREVLSGSAHVYRSEYWSEASDHRAVFATIIPVNKK